MIVPTGIGATIGGFAADANPACKLLAKASDLLITHPNVVNGAMMTDIPDNVMVIDGYLLDRFFAGQLAFRDGVKHKIGVVVDSAANESERELTQNCINAARVVYGMDIIEEIFYTKDPVEANDLIKIGNNDTLLDACAEARDTGATALAVMAVLDESANSQAAQNYTKAQGYDPIGQIEAKISHLVSQIFLMPSAHAPILREARELGSSEVREQENGTAATAVHPKVAAEYLSDCFLASVFKCLQHAPQVIPLPMAYKMFTNIYTDPEEMGLQQKADDIVVSDLANLVVPYDCCNSTPMTEAWKHEIELLCVENNTTNLDEPAAMFNISHKLVANYLEAAGYLIANTKDDSFINPELF